jgi:CheY-like chemotaxis protein
MHPAVAYEMERVGLDPFERQPGDHAILVVGDDRNFRETVARWLIPLGYRVSTAADGPGARAAAARQHPDLAVLDGPDAVAVSHELRSHPLTERLPVLVMASAGAFDAVRAGLAAGPHAYVVGPPQPRLLVHEIEDVLQFRAHGLTVR